MALGKGKYDDLCTQAREQAQAEGAILIIFNGGHGNGFSAQLPLHIVQDMPKILRQIADEMEQSFKEGKL